jgi:hypothetical protein
MSTITAVIPAHSDGTLHLPLPKDLIGKLVEVTATLKSAEHPNQQRPQATPEMIARRKEAFRKLRESGGLQAVIPDPIVWQNELREDRPLPGRD